MEVGETRPVMGVIVMIPVTNCKTISARIKDFYQFWLRLCFRIIIVLEPVLPDFCHRWIGYSIGKRMIMTEVPSATKSPLAGTARKGPRGEVRIFATWCKGCQICVAFCPTNVLAMHSNGDHPIVVAPEKCTACHFCDTHCPDLAILVKKIE